MAGDLFIENITYDQRKMLIEAGATEVKTIFHADRPFDEYKNVLIAQLQAAAVNNRHHLPAHAYFTFKAADRQTYNTYIANQINALRMDDFLKKCRRALGVVANNANLANFPGNTPLSAATLLGQALNSGNVTVEYYKYDGTAVLNVYKYGGWVLANE